MAVDRKTLSAGIRDALRDLSHQLNLLGRRVGAHVDLKETELDCLDVVVRTGPITAGALSRATGIHAATLTGILDRLEERQWVRRTRDGTDRRAVHVEANTKQVAGVFRLYGGMTRSIAGICADYRPEQLAVIAEFLRRTHDAAEAAVGDLE